MAVSALEAAHANKAREATGWMEGGRGRTMIQLPFPSFLTSFLSMGKCHNGRISLSDKPSSLKVNRSPRRRWKMNLTYLRFSHTRHTILSAPEPASALRIACIGPSLDPPPHLPTHSLGHSHSPITADYKRVTVVRPSSVRPLVGLRRPSLVRNVTRGGCTVFPSPFPIPPSLPFFAANRLSLRPTEHPFYGGRKCTKGC